MPHLSPMNWLIAPALFLLFITPMVIASMWWSQHPTFPSITQPTQTSTGSHNKWNWN